MENHEVNDAEDQESKSKKPTRHDEQGAADLEKVTDYHEDVELSAGASSIIQNINKTVKKDIQTTKIKVKSEDVNLIVKEMEVSNKVAEAKLKEHNGDVVQTLLAMLN